MSDSPVNMIKTGMDNLPLNPKRGKNEVEADVLRSSTEKNDAAQELKKDNVLRFYNDNVTFVNFYSS